jgi:fatty acid synthase, animal type
MEVVADMCDSQTIDNADNMVDQFRDHFKKLASGETGAKWVSRFCKAYVAHREFIILTLMP